MSVGGRRVARDSQEGHPALATMLALPPPAGLPAVLGLQCSHTHGGDTVYG